MNLRNLTPFLMLDHFHVSEGAVSCNDQFKNSLILRNSNRGFLIIPIVAKQL